MNEYTEILELMKFAEDTIRFSITTGFIPSPEHRMIVKTLRLLDLCRAKVLEQAGHHQATIDAFEKYRERYPRIDSETQELGGRTGG